MPFLLYDLVGLCGKASILNSDLELKEDSALSSLLYVHPFGRMMGTMNMVNPPSELVHFQYGISRVKLEALHVTGEIDA